MRDLTFVMDHSNLPRRLSLNLDPAVVERLEALSQRSGRCVDEVALQLLDRTMQDPRFDNASPPS